jgi:hypothetical protein
LDPFLAGDCSGDPDSDLLAREVSEGATLVRNSAVRVAILGGVCRALVAPARHRHSDIGPLDRGEALIEKCIPQNIARWQPDWRNEVVFE